MAWATRNLCLLTCYLPWATIERHFLKPVTSSYALMFEMVATANLFFFFFFFLNPGSFGPLVVAAQNSRVAPLGGLFDSGWSFSGMALF